MFSLMLGCRNVLLVRQSVTASHEPEGGHVVNTQTGMTYYLLLAWDCPVVSAAHLRLSSIWSRVA